MAENIEKSHLKKNKNMTKKIAKYEKRDKKNKM